MMRLGVTVLAIAAFAAAPALASAQSTTSPPVTGVAHGAASTTTKTTTVKKGLFGLGKPKTVTTKTATATTASPGSATEKTTTTVTRKTLFPSGAAKTQTQARTSAATVPNHAMEAGGSMKACAAQWNALPDAQKAAYKTQASGMKSKSGRSLSGYNVFTGECLKKK